MVAWAAAIEALGALGISDWAKELYGIVAENLDKSGVIAYGLLRGYNAAKRDGYKGLQAIEEISGYVLDTLKDYGMLRTQRFSPSVLSELFLPRRCRSSWGALHSENLLGLSF